MDTQSIITYKSAFDSIMHEIEADDGSKMEVWYARIANGVWIHQMGELCSCD